jgi:hypothetical protein
MREHAPGVVARAQHSVGRGNGGVVAAVAARASLQNYHV